MDTPLWSKEFKGSGTARVVSELGSVYFLNGSQMYAGMKITRLDINSGEVLSSYLTRAHVYDLAFSKDFSEVLANTDRKIFLLSSKTLSEIKRWETRVPKLMGSPLRFDNILAMKGGMQDAVILYDLNTSKVQRFNLGRGEPLFPDIFPDSLLACCGVDGSIWRLNVLSGKRENILTGLLFDDAAMCVKTETLWLSEATPERLNGNFFYAFGKSTNILRSVSVRDPSNVQRFNLEFLFSRLAIDSSGEFLWVVKEKLCGTCPLYHPTHVCILSVREKLKEVDQFKLPGNFWYLHLDAQAGLIFTDGRFSGESRILLNAWKFGK